MDVVLIAFLAIVLGSLFQTVVQYLAKYIQAQGKITFNGLYIATMVLSIILVFMADVGIFLAWPIPDNVPTAYVFGLALLEGFTINVGVNVGVNTGLALKNNS